MRDNPYASPAYLPAEPAALVDPQHRTRPLRAFGRWTLICVVSAAPSFFWGCGLHARPEHIAAMLAGVFVFVLAYTAIECTHYYHQVITLPHVHRTALIGYGTRILISLIFPIGLTVDMFTGIVSVSLVESVLTGYRAVDGESQSVLGVFLTTLLQGLLLNLLVFGYMLLVYSGLRISATIAGKMRQGRETAA